MCVVYRLNISMSKLITVVTTFNESIWELFASKTLPTWLKFFDDNINFHFHTSEFKPLNNSRISYFTDSENKINFLNRNINLKRVPHKKIKGPGKKWDIYCHKVFAQCESAKIINNSYMLFLDADVALLNNFSIKIFEHFLNKNFCGFVGRDPLLTETGIIMYDLSYNNSNKFFDKFEKIYTEDKLFDLDSWCDCSAFDHLRNISELPFENLSGKYNKFIDPIAVGPLGEYFDHWIGKSSKLKGFSKHRKFRGKI